MPKIEYAKNQQMLSNLNEIVDLLPGLVYWKDNNGIYLGINTLTLKASGIKSFSEFIGKTDYDLWPQYADDLVKHDQEVIRTGRPLHTEEIVIHTQTKEIKYYAVAKIALRDGDGKIIGVLGNSIDITAQKKGTLHYLESIAPSLPGPIYWKDKNSVYLGMNSFALEVAGIKSFSDFIGKTDYDLWPQYADDLVKHDQEVMQTGMAVNKEETIAQSDGTIKHFTVIKTPLRDDEGNVIGIIGNSIDVTAEKEAKKLKRENAEHKIKATEQEKFRKIADQVAHDIRSPLATFEMVLPHCNQLPEDLRLTLNQAATRISDIANNLLNKYTPNNDTIADSTTYRISLISSALLELLTEKKYEYSKKLVEFITDISPSGYFAFINADIPAFKRMLSNLINNAVDAFDNNKGKVTIHLGADNETVEVIIEDNGKGMPRAIVDKILNAVAVTAGKKDGHGIGLTQVRDTLSANQGQLKIESAEGTGTKIILSFPKVPAPDWMCQSVELTADSTIVILDDDESIHGAWATKLDQAAPTIKRKHFTLANEVIEYIFACEAKSRSNLVLLTDYELLGQGLNGLDVIKQAKLNSAILVTSHYNNKNVLETAKLSNTKILPKSLASVVAVNISAATAATPKADNGLKQVDLVVIDDDKTLVRNLLNFVLQNKQVDVYHSTADFLPQATQYAKDTKFLIDNQFKGEILSGLDIAEQLHQHGFSGLYLFSGLDFDDGSTPDYLTIIKKQDITGIQRLVGLI